MCECLFVIPWIFFKFFNQEERHVSLNNSLQTKININAFCFFGMTKKAEVLETLSYPQFFDSV